MVIEWALSFTLGVFTAFFLMVVFGIRPFRGRRVRAEDPFKGAIERRLSSGPFIVAVGGGTGLSTLLKGMKAFTRNITAVVPGQLVHAPGGGGARGERRKRVVRAGERGGLRKPSN